MIWLNPATAPFARVWSTAISSTRRHASSTSIASSRANDSIAATVASPIPRFGVFTARRNEIDVLRVHQQPEVRQRRP